MRLHLIVLAATAFMASAAYADDHLFNAGHHGLILDEENDAVFNKAGHQIPDNGHGQGSPFVGEHQCTPSSDNGAAHATPKPRGTEADCTPEE
jgi:hypothetical protein